jgi:hypothetical protein
MRVGIDRCSARPDPTGIVWVTERLSRLSTDTEPSSVSGTNAVRVGGSIATSFGLRPTGIV